MDGCKILQKQNGSLKGVETSSQIRRDTNERIYMRNVPIGGELQPYLDVRPLNSKYTRLPIVEPRVLDHAVPLKCYPTYAPSKIFNPGNRDAPFSGYASAINVESDLKGQIFALQKCSQAVYVPKSTSSLYQDEFVTQSGWMGEAVGSQTHDLLFKQEKFDEFNPNVYSGVVGVQLWGNATRSQIYNIPLTPYGSCPSAPTSAPPKR